jgi:hypothetical protein
MSVAASSHDPDLVYAGTRPPALYVTRDRGGSWTELPGLRARRRFWWMSPAEPPGLTPYVQAIALSPTDPDVILAGIELGGVLRSADGGRTWSGHRKKAVLDCHTLRFHDHDGDWVYEGGGTGGGAAFSRDAGRTWTQPREGKQRRYGWAVAADPVDPSCWYTSASPFPSLLKGQFAPPAHIDGQADAGVYRRVGEEPWQELRGLPNPMTHMAYALVTDPDRPSHLYAGLADGSVWHSEDRGDSWTRLPEDLGHLSDLRILR